MNLLQEYKELYYKEIEFSDRLNSKISICITFLTILGSAQIVLWTQLKNFNSSISTNVYIVFCSVTTILFIICIWKFFKTYSGYHIQMFPIDSYAKQNSRVLSSVVQEQKGLAHEVLEIKMAERFINDAIQNRKINFIKNTNHRHLINTIMITFIFTFISFTINVYVDYHETKYNNCINQQQTQSKGGDKMEDEIQIDTNIVLKDSSGQTISVQTQAPEILVETFACDAPKNTVLNESNDNSQSK